MTQSRLLPLSLTLVGLAVAAGSAGAEPATLVILVRHAEKSAGGADPPLSEAGEARAEALRAALAAVPIDRVVTSEFRRTRDTAGPLCTERGLEPMVIGTDGGFRRHLERTVDAVLEKPGGSVLVVGHANTVPRIIEALGGPSLEDLDEGTYDALFTLVLEAGRPARLIRSRYGAGSGD